MLSAYIALGVPPENLVTASVMSIPASIAISKMRMPERDEPVTRGRVTIDRGNEKDRPANALHAFSKGALFGLIVAGPIPYVPPSPHRRTHTHTDADIAHRSPLPLSRSTGQTCSRSSRSSPPSTAS